MVAIYRMLLLLFPAPFRRRYGSEMVRAFAERRAALRAGWTQRRAFELGALRDLLTSALGERAGLAGPGPAIRRRGRSGRFLESVAQDVGFSTRILRREPMLSAFSIATLALGIGAVTVAASVIDAVLLRPLPYPEPRQLVSIFGVTGGRRAAVSYENFRDLTTSARSFTATSPFFSQTVNLTGVAQPDRLRGGFVGSGFFDVVGVRPALGRAFGSESDQPGSARVAVLSDAAWRYRFASAADIVGRTLHLNNTPVTVIGVMPPDFEFPIDDVEVWLPISTTTTSLARDSHNYRGLARLAPGVPVEAAAAECATIAARLEQAHPGANRGRTLGAEPLHETLTGETAGSLRLLGAMVLLMLLTACANAAGLQLGAAAMRRRELTVRAALGAARGRIMRQLVTESLVRAGAGALPGVAAAVLVIRYLAAHAPGDVYGLKAAGLGGIAVATTILATLVAGLLVALPPAWQWTRGALPASGSRTVSDAGTTRARAALVVAQVALAAVLMIGVGLVARSFLRLTSVDLGFDPSSVLTMEYRLPRNKYATVEAQAGFHSAVIEKIRALPGVRQAAGARALPFSGNASTASFEPAQGGERLTASFNAVSADFFDVMRIPLIAGRRFDVADRDPVVIVSRSLADSVWPGAALGRKVYFDEASIVATVIGVAGDIRHRDFADAETRTIYTSLAQNPGVFNTLIVRTTGEPMALAETVRRAVWTVDANQPLWKIRALDTLVDQSLATRRFLVRFAASFGGSAVLLALVGLYGVVSATVVQRRREIGVRVAVGASPNRIVRLVLWNGMTLAVSGLAIGLAAAYLAAGALQAYLFEIGARDPLTFVMAAVLLFAATACACWLPARRVLHVDPVAVLRES